MTQNTTGYGSQIRIVASSTYPAGITVTQFADDADGFDLASIKIADAAMGLNGDLITFSKPVPIPFSVGVIPGSDDDVALQILAEQNRVGAGKVSAYDLITASIGFPDGSTVTLTGGIITDEMPGNSLSSAGRFKTKVYGFIFENIIGA